MDIKYLTVDHLSTKDLIRIFSKISIDPSISWNGTPCWVWIGALTQGYSLIWFPQTGKYEKVHRVLYAWAIKPVPRRIKGQRTPNIDHLCRNKACVNPAHLELVPPRVNIFRAADAPASINALKTHCPQGHLLDSVKTVKGQQERCCSICRRAEWQRRDPQKAAEAAARYRQKNLELVRFKDRIAQAKHREKLRHLRASPIDHSDASS